MFLGGMIHTKFYKDWFRYSEVDTHTHTHTHTKQGDLISFLLFFK
jgi:hypothetical protein